MNNVRHPRSNTALGLVIIAVLLFPIYWMVNASLQPGGAGVDTPWFPLNPDLAGYRTAFEEQGRNLLTSLIVAIGSVILSLIHI
mgnify:CR=1 FL=1